VVDRTLKSNYYYYYYVFFPPWDPLEIRHIIPNDAQSDGISREAGEVLSTTVAKWTCMCFQLHQCT